MQCGVMKPATSPDSLRIQSLLGDGFKIVEFDASTRTSAEAAAAIGCEVAQIAKSIMLKTAKDQKPVLVIASGINRIDEKKVAAVLGEKVKSADADYVLAHAGVAPGGVPPIGHRVPPTILLDEDLSRMAEIWAAGGSPHAVFRLTWGELVQLTGGTAADVKKVQAI